MNCEIIIAARGELPKNLTHTIESIRATSGKNKPLISVIFDGTESPPMAMQDVKCSVPWTVPRGCGQARNYGIMQSSADVIIICDGHMDFPDGWLDKVMAHHARHKKDVTCCQMRSLGKGFKPIDERIYTGAYIAYKKVEQCDGFRDYHALKGTWNSEGTKPGQMGCIMGACYAFRRSFYECMGKPLELCDEWGQDEELLSLGAYFAGGRVVCLPPIVGHYYAAPNINRVSAHPDAIARRIASRFVVIDTLPITNAEADDLRLWIKQRPRDYRTICVHAAKRYDLAAQVRQLRRKNWHLWAKLKEQGFIREWREPPKADVPDHEEIQSPSLSLPVFSRSPAITTCRFCNLPSATGKIGLSNHVRCIRCGRKVTP